MTTGILLKRKWPLYGLSLILAIGALNSTALAQKSKTKKPGKKTEQKTVPQKTTAPPATAKTQKTNKPAEPSKAEGTADEQKVRDIIAFLQFLLNTLGSKETLQRDKDVMIIESYSKIFRDENVQIEDDLDAARRTITNKDVVSYLKDVDFFFTNVKFEFVIDDIKKSMLPNGQSFYKVTLSRNLTGTTPEGKPVTNTLRRFVEINFNPDDQDLKIASIYTNEFDETKALLQWWSALSLEWKQIFRRKLSLPDSVVGDDIKNITAIEELDLSNNLYIQNLEPLTPLVGLRLLDLSNTLVRDLTPIRNLTELVEVNLSKTPVADLSPLRYAVKIQRLNLSHTKVTDISALEKMTGLQSLEMRGIPATDFGPLVSLASLRSLNVATTQLSTLIPVSGLTRLSELDITRTRIQDLTDLQGIKNLTKLVIDSTRVQSLAPLDKLDSLKELHVNFTPVDDLRPLQSLRQLKKIYCDHTLIHQGIADEFMRTHPGAVVIFDSKDLHAWWGALSADWQTTLSTSAQVAAIPSSEELVRITNLDSVNIQGASSIRSLEPLRKLQKLRILIAGKTGIDDLSPLEEHRDIVYLDISSTGVHDLFVTRQFTKLEELHADGTKTESLDPLHHLKSLKKVYVDHAAIHDIAAREFLGKNDHCLLVYKTSHLNRWWSALPPEWKDVFREQLGTDTASSRENLHRLVELKALRFKEAPVNDLAALNEFVNLQELHFAGTGIHEIPPLENILGLRSLHATNSPIEKIETLGLFKNLEDLDISNTAVSELHPLIPLQDLKKLNCAGTPVKKLDVLERIETLEWFDCSNTRVTDLDAIMNLPLKTLRCYNTKISARQIEKFKSLHPQSTVVYYR